MIENIFYTIVFFYLINIIIYFYFQRDFKYSKRNSFFNLLEEDLKISTSNFMEFFLALIYKGAILIMFLILIMVIRGAFFV